MLSKLLFIITIFTVVDPTSSPTCKVFSFIKHKKRTIFDKIYIYCIFTLGDFKSEDVSIKTHHRGHVIHEQSKTV